MKRSMRGHLRPSRRVLCLMLLLTITAGVHALSYLSVETGQMVVFNPDEGALSPIVTAVGAAIPFIEVGVFRFELSTLIWGTQYYVAPTGRTVPAQYEAGQFTVLGVWLAPLAGVNFQIARGKLELGAAATMALNFRFPLFPWDPPESDAAWAATWSTAATYFFGNARFLFPETDIWIRWRVAESLSLALTVKALYPLFHLWDRDGATAGDQFMLAVVLGFDIPIEPRRAADQEAAP